MVEDKLKNDVVNGEIVHIGGLERDVEDKRDFPCGAFLNLFGSYKTKAEQSNNKSFSIKNQFHNTCGWNSSGNQKEDDEKKELSIRVFVMFGKRDGFVTGDGFSSMRNNQKVIQKCGIPEMGFIEETTNSWEEYADPSKITQEMIDNAFEHRSQSYAAVTTKDELLKLLDSGRTLQTGMDWYEEYNMRGGFSMPWKIDFVGREENKIGGHALKILNYRDNGNTLQIQMSSGSNWGDNGCFYTPTDWLLKHWYGAFVQFDIPVDIASFLAANQFMFVRGTGLAIYQIVGNQKYAFPDMATLELYSDGKWKENYKRVSEALIQAISDGPLIRIQDDPKWPMLQTLATPDRWKEIMKHLSEI